MRAALLTAWRAPLEIGEVAEPVCPIDGVVLEVLACGVCRSDWHAWSGADSDVSLPHIPGHEFCGTVVEVGADVRRFKVGDRVIAPFILACGACADCQGGHQTVCASQVVPGFTVNGAFAERIAVVRADVNLTALPEGMSPAVAAAMGCRVTTAWQALTARAGVAPGEWLGIWGGGGVGVAALLLAKALGARVALVDIAPDKLDFARALGADAVIDGRGADPVAEMRDVSGGGVHVALEALGIPQTVGNALRSCRKMGRMVQVGMPAGAHTTMALPWDALYSGQLTVMGTRGMPARRMPGLLEFIAASDLDLSAMIAREVGLSDASAELALFDTVAPPGVAVITDFRA